MKKILLLTLAIILLVLLAVWSPWLRWNFNIAGLFGVSKPEAISGLTVNSLAGEIEVFLDNQSVAKVTPEVSPFILDRVTPGEHLVTIKRTGDFASTYSSLNKLLTFEENSSVVITYNIGPDEVFSEGHIIYTTKKEGDVNSKLNISVNTDEFNFTYDGLPVEKVKGKNKTLDLDFNSQHTIKISKSGFESLEFTILPETQEERDLLKQFDLNVEVQLMLQPVEVVSN
jgi:hypothetical protein